MEHQTFVRKENILLSLQQLGVTTGDIIIVHSSLRSFGYVEGGAKTVAEALLEAVSEEGTLCVPTLITQDFQNAYKTWYMDKPSEVGALTEFVRKMPGAFRSNQATHSLAAIGKLAKELTKEHTEYGNRKGVYGDTAFSAASPWQKLYDMNAKVLLIGVNLCKNTLKHLMEYIIIEEALKAAGNKSEIIDKLRVFEKRLSKDESLVWPWIDCDKMERIGQEAHLINYADCGNAHLTLFRNADVMHASLLSIAKTPEEWFAPHVVNWLYVAFGSKTAFQNKLLSLLPRCML